jgi:AraC-like DNA-binding protein
VAAASYREQPPPSALGSRVACLWRLDPGADTDPGEVEGHAVLPDGCVDLVWHGGILAVAGPDTGPVRSEPSRELTLGVRFRPGAAADVLGESAAGLRDQRVPVEQLWGRAGRELAERVAAAAGTGERLALLVATVAARPGTAEPVDPVIAEAVALLTTGGVPVARLARTVALSERQLRRRFVDHVGYGPKTLDRILRLQRFLAAVAAADDGPGLAELALVAGYADQAHLGREARALAGASPLALRRRWAPVAPEAATTSETDKTGGRRSVTIGV